MRQSLIPQATPDTNGQGAIEPDELVRRALSGCAEALQELVMFYAPRLLVLLTPRHGGNRADAEDVVQEAALRAFQRWQQFDPRYSFRVWFFTIAFRISTDHLRKLKRESLRLERQKQRITAPAAEPCAMEQQEAIQNIWKTAEQELGEYHFSVLWLSLGEELNNREIAQVLGKNVLSIRVALHRAKKILANHLIEQRKKSPIAESTNQQANHL